MRFLTFFCLLQGTWQSKLSLHRFVKWQFKNWIRFYFFLILECAVAVHKKCANKILMSCGGNAELSHSTIVSCASVFGTFGAVGHATLIINSTFDFSCWESDSSWMFPIVSNWPHFHLRLSVTIAARCSTDFSSKVCNAKVRDIFFS